SPTTNMHVAGHGDNNEANRSGGEVDEDYRCTEVLVCWCCYRRTAALDPANRRNRRYCPLGPAFAKGRAKRQGLLPECLAFSWASGVPAFLQGQLDAFHEQIMDFASLVEGDLPQRLIGGIRQRSRRLIRGGLGDRHPTHRHSLVGLSCRLR